MTSMQLGFLIGFGFAIPVILLIVVPIYKKKIAQNYIIGVAVGLLEARGIMYAVGIKPEGDTLDKYNNGFIHALNKQKREFENV